MISAATEIGNLLLNFALARARQRNAFLLVLAVSCEKSSTEQLSTTEPVPRS